MLGSFPLEQILRMRLEHSYGSQSNNTVFFLNDNDLAFFKSFYDFDEILLDELKERYCDAYH